MRDDLLAVLVVLAVCVALRHRADMDGIDDLSIRSLGVAEAVDLALPARLYFASAQKASAIVSEIEFDGQHPILSAATEPRSPSSGHLLIRYTLPRSSAMLT